MICFGMVTPGRTRRPKIFPVLESFPRMSLPLETDTSASERGARREPLHDYFTVDAH
jgi:hypothetical protein